MPTALACLDSNGQPARGMDGELLKDSTNCIDYSESNPIQRMLGAGLIVMATAVIFFVVARAFSAKSKRKK